jgi:hypothetical protein
LFTVNGNLATNKGRVLNSKKYTIEELRSFNDDEIILYLKKYWGISDEESIDVTGLLSSHLTKNGTYLYSLEDIRLINGDLFSYPIVDLTTNWYNIFVPQSFDRLIKNEINKGKVLTVSCRLILTKISEREKHNNPCELIADPNSIMAFDEIGDEYIIRSDDQRILIKSSIIYRCIKENTKLVEEEIKKINNERDFIFNDTQIKKEAWQEEIKILSHQVNSLSENINFLENSINENETYKKLILNEISELEISLKNGEKNMAEKLEKFKSFVKSKADNLLKLEFIDEEEYNDILMINHDKVSNEVFINFHEELNGDLGRAVSHIQAYLFNNDIIYPRYIIEDFFALIKTNDLIILAGESGSGKTNLIKSFAKAVGGKSIIIPVKPNWTSAEDLLGYYNPLEKKYLSTPFLDALFEAKRNQNIPYFICLDEMNLARVEYYFADFLSLLEERSELPEIKLYSEDESSHVLSEFKNVLYLIEQSKDKYQKNNIIDFLGMLKDEEINSELKRVFGFSEKDSLIKYHSDLRRMISGIINTPSSVFLPKNVRIIGAINIDETTHYLSPKILDRAHIMKFDSPLLNDWEKIEQEVEINENSIFKLKFEIEDFGVRNPYPSFNIKDDFVRMLIDFSKKYLHPLGVEFGMRTIRQGLNYRDIFLKINNNHDLVLNNFIIHKILPKMMFDGNNSGKKEVLVNFKNDIDSLLKNKIHLMQGKIAVEELESLIKKSDANENIVNYWA